MLLLALLAVGDALYGGGMVLGSAHRMPLAAQGTLYLKQRTNRHCLWQLQSWYGLMESVMASGHSDPKVKVLHGGVPRGGPGDGCDVGGPSPRRPILRLLLQTHQTVVPPTLSSIFL